jgi:beta-phosphoglucomutase-like phosphatase (HAD superfamily)
MAEPSRLEQDTLARPGAGPRGLRVVRISGVGAVELVIFDCDGVLVDSERISNGVLARMLTEEGLPTTLAQARRDYQGLLLSEVASRVRSRLGRPLSEGWIERFEHERAEVFYHELRPVPGAAETIARVSATGVAVCVASQGRVEKTRLSLGLTGLRGLFPGGALFSAESVLRGKPYPDLFLHAAASMGARPRAAWSWKTRPRASPLGWLRGCACLGMPPTVMRRPYGRRAERSCDPSKSSPHYSGSADPARQEPSHGRCVPE